MVVDLVEVKAHAVAVAAAAAVVADPVETGVLLDANAYKKRAFYGPFFSPSQKKRHQRLVPHLPAPMSVALGIKRFALRQNICAVKMFAG